MFANRPTVVSALSTAALLVGASSALADDVVPRTPLDGRAPVVQQRAKQRVIDAPQPSVRRVPGHFIVRLRAGQSPRTFAQKAGAHADHLYRHTIRGFSARLSADQVRKLKHDRRVKSVEQDAYGEVDAVQGLDAGGNPWGIDRTDQRFGLSGSYTFGATGAGVRAYVIDTGIDTTNPQFGGRAQNVYDAFGGNGEDCHGHGTHVSGTIGGATYGLAKQVLLRGVRIMGCSGGYTDATLIAALDWVRANAIKPAVVNMSIGGPRSDAVNQAARALADSGVFVAVAAGNENSPACDKSPASAYGTFTVGAMDRTDTRWASSNYGGCVDGYAPGVGVMSSLPGNRSASWTGTSMATPHVAGIVALAKQAFGDRPSATYVQWLISNATVNAINANPIGTPNRLVWKGSL